MKRIIRVTLAALSGAFVALPIAANAETTADDAAFADTDSALAFHTEFPPVGDAELGESRGTFSPADILNLDVATQNASSSNNSVVGGVTGSNVIGDSSFSNTQGLVNVIQNSGNNVVIQSSTIVNMTMVNN